MILLLISLAIVAFAVLVLSTLVQMLYMEALRLRTRETPALEFFKGTLEDRIGVKTENGALTFSLIKHALIALFGILYLGLFSMDNVLTREHFIESMLFAWAVLIAGCYVVPPLLYRQTSCSWLLALLPILRGFTIVVRPLVALLGFLQSLANLGEKELAAEDASTSAENIEALISAGAEEGIIEEDDRKLIQSAAAFGSKTVREVMTPRPAMVTISAEATLDDLRRLVINEQYSRIPVCEKTIDRIVGFVHVRDMFELSEDDRSRMRVRELARPVRLVPETKPVDHLLREMQRDGAHMAIVIDEYGNTAGIVTMEDMVEEIIGEIRDEHEPAADVRTEPDGSFVMSGSFDVDHLEELLGYRPPEGTESTTIGGLVSEWMGRVPETGESVEHDGIRIEVLAGNELRVDQVRVSKVAAEKAHSEADARSN